MVIKLITKKYLKTKDEIAVTFEFNLCRSDLKSVSLFGDFNNWEPTKMIFVKKSKSFKVKINLPKEKIFQFKYLLDSSEWENDYKADQYIKNEFGSENSIVNTAI